MKKLKNDMDLEYYFNINILIKWDQWASLDNYKNDNNNNNNNNNNDNNKKIPVTRAQII